MLTREQAAAVAAEGNVLLMAGAGTGKTSTLVARVLDRALQSERRLSLDRLLMVTFTEAAALEMRRRLRAELQKHLDDPNHQAQAELQLAKLETAAIGTIHAFCLRLIRDHFHELGLDPQLRVLDEAEAGELRERTLNSVLEPLLVGDEAFPKAVQDFIATSLGGDLNATLELVLRLDSYARSRHDAAAWLEAQAAHWSAAEPRVWLQQIRDLVPAWAREWQQRLEPIAAANAKAAECRSLLESLTRQLGAENWRTAAGAGLAVLLSADSDAAWKAFPKQKLKLREPVGALFDEAAFLAPLVVRPSGQPDPVVEDWDWTRPQIVALIRLVQRFEEAFSATKRSLGVLDFADLEQLALRLLGDGTTSVARTCRQRYEAVFVDEAQDLNPAQDAILRAVGRTGREANRFLVGDVKQSIYRFRLADPRIFQTYARDWTHPDPEGEPRQVLPLTDNFRSHAGVLEFVNAVFSSLMHPALGGVGYDAGAQLHFGGAAERPQDTLDGRARVEVHLRLASRRSAAADDTGEANSDDDPAESEARVVARRLKELRASNVLVWDRVGKAQRPLRWSDVVILLRAPGPRGGAWARVLREEGVPLATPPGPFFEQLEVQEILSLLQILDNPLQDIPLAAVLRSPFADLAEVNEMAVLRLAARRERYWTALQRFRELGAAVGLSLEATTADPPVASGGTGTGTGMTLAAFGPLEGEELFQHPATRTWAERAFPRVNRFLDRFARWRRLAQRGSMVTLLESVLDDVGYEARLDERSEPALSRAVVRQFLNLARHFDQTQRGGLLRFLGQLETHRLAQLESVGTVSGDAVRLMSFHRSKGLEFPVVVVAGLGNRFNYVDLHAPILIEEHLGLGPWVVTPAGTRYPSWPRWQAGRELRRELLGEELRLLYVAFTRACDRLILLGTASPTAAEDWTPAPANTRDLAQLAAAHSALDWLGPVFCRLAGLAHWDPAARGANALIEWDTSSGPLPGLATTDPSLSSPILPSTPPGTKGVLDGYPHVAATRETAKLAVTALRRRAQQAEAEDDEARPSFPDTDAVVRIQPRGRPEAHGLTGAERGSLHHRFLELVRLDRTATHEALRQEIERLTAEGRFTGEEAAEIDLGAIARFWDSPLGKELRAASNRVRREIPFTLRLSPADLRRLGLPVRPGLGEEEFLIVQGVIDVAQFLPDGTIQIGDYKTDQVTEESLNTKVDAYRPQLALYAFALEQIFRRRVSRRWLHFLAVGATIEV